VEDFAFDQSTLPALVSCVGAPSVFDPWDQCPAVQGYWKNHAEQGHRVGNIAYGFRLSTDGLHLEPEPAEQAALAAIRQLRNGGHSLRRIATTLNHDGQGTSRGTP